MRVSGDACGAREAEPRRGAFGDALARASGVDAERRSVAATVRSVDAGAPIPEPAQTELVPDPSPVAELAAVARALPPAIATARAVDGPLALSFGRSLDVELRSTGAGIELLLRPEACLARAAEAELPRMVAALRVRGVAVARAEVRPRPGSGGRAR